MKAPTLLPLPCLHIKPACNFSHCAASKCLHRS